LQALEADWEHPRTTHVQWTIQRSSERGAEETHGLTEVYALQAW
jgi:hypothetical protein